MAGPGQKRERLDQRCVFADRTNRYSAPRSLMFAALTVNEAMWWVHPQPGEVAPRVLEAVPFTRVVWSSFWPVSPNDTIEFELSDSEDGDRYLSAGRMVEDKPTLIRFQWLTDYPPDARGVAITRQRLNQKLGGTLRAVVSAYYWDGPTGIIPMTVDGRSVDVPVVAPRKNL